MWWNAVIFILSRGMLPSMRQFYRLLIAAWIVIAIAVILYTINGGFMQFGS